MHEVYGFVERLEAACREHGALELAQQLDDAMHISSSGLEIIGSITGVLKQKRDSVARILPPEEDRIDEVLAFADRAFGR